MVFVTSLIYLLEFLDVSRCCRNDYQMEVDDFYPPNNLLRGGQNNFSVDILLLTGFIAQKVWAIAYSEQLQIVISGST